MDDDLTFGQWLQRRRKAFHLTQQDLGNLAICAAETIRKIEADMRQPSAELARLLADALQIPESEHLTFFRFARGDSTASPGLLPMPTSGVAPRPLHAPTNIPIPLTLLIGRQAEVEGIAALLERNAIRLVTLTGPGGVGKTRVAIAVASTLRDAFADGIVFVDLSPLTDHQLVLTAIAEALGVRETADEALTATVQAQLRERQVLLVLDNFERVPPASTVVAELLQGVARLKVLITSRIRLKLRGEREVVVEPLAVPRTAAQTAAALTAYDAVRLFVERAQDVKADFVLTNANASAVAEICARLDGLPLAIELAAARVKVLSPDGLLQRLGSRLQVLTGGARDLPARQQTLRNTLDWSYSLLEPVEHVLFGRLAVFAGGCTLEAAEALSGRLDDLAGNVLDTVDALVAKSLLQRDEQVTGELRFRMLESVREFGLEQLHRRGEARSVQHQHATFFLTLAEAGAPTFTGDAPGPWLRSMSVEQDNLRAALTWLLACHEIEMGLRLIGALWPWYWREAPREGLQWAEAFLNLLKGVEHTRTHARVLFAAGTLAWGQRQYHLARARIEKSIAIYREHGDRQSLAEAGLWWAALQLPFAGP